VNFASHTFLSEMFEVQSFPIIHPKVDLLSKIISVAQKSLGFKRIYHHFSEFRLKQVALQYLNFEKSNISDAYFFHGFTQWIKTTPSKPYYCFNDACFATYVEIYNNRSDFSQKDLYRIYNQESKWLANAKKVFFRSQWALEETKKAYQLLGDNFVNVGVGGFIDIPEKDEYNGELVFLFISREFVPKGGLVVLEAFKKIAKDNPEAKLWIVGQNPGSVIIDEAGVEYKGFFRKNVAEELVQLKEIFAQAFCLVHPTLKDTNTLVVNELAYFGCPAIASNRFAIPEYIKDGETGFLIDNPLNVDEVAEKMQAMIEHKAYTTIRNKCRSNALQNNTWEIVFEKIKSQIKTENIQ
jgi:glycosyltransferase involved in cell wall biosynthesis